MENPENNSKVTIYHTIETIYHLRLRVSSFLYLYETFFEEMCSNFNIAALMFSQIAPIGSSAKWYNGTKSLTFVMYEANRSSLDISMKTIKKEGARTK